MDDKETMAGVAGGGVIGSVGDWHSTSPTLAGASGSGDYDRAGEGDAQRCTVWVVWVLFEYGI